MDKENLKSDEFKLHFDKWNFFDFEDNLKKSLSTPGQLFLYENYISTAKGPRLTYPKLSIYVDAIPCDQTLEIECVDIKRTRDKLKNPTLSSGLSRYIQWGDYLLIYGIWDSYPNWKELRIAYEKTWWYHKTKPENRDIKINKILNG